MKVDYRKGRIYKLWSLVSDKVYIGSTCQSLNKRLQQHKGDFKRYKNNKYGFLTSFLIIEEENYRIDLIEEYPCDNKEQLLSREAYHIKNSECVNKQIPFRCADEKKENKKQYYKNNKDDILEKREIYRTIHREEINEKKKEDNKKYSEKYNDRYKCESCNFKTYSKRDFERHSKTKKHLSNNLQFFSLLII